MHPFKAPAVRAFAVACLVAPAVPNIAHAQSDLSSAASWPAADQATLRGYRLTIDRVRRIFAAYDEVSEVDTTTDADSWTTLDIGIAALSTPADKAVLAKHQLTPREFVVGFVEIQEAASAFYAHKTGRPPLDNAASLENVQFYAAHQSELEHTIAPSSP